MRKKLLRHWSSIALVLGFIFDNLTLNRSDSFWVNLVLAGYLALAFIGFTYVSLFEVKKWNGVWPTRFHFWANFIAQFSLGNLFSGLAVFYLASGTWSASWPFLLIIFGILLGNEFLQQWYARLTFRTLALYAALYFFLIFHLPIVFNRMSDGVFLLAGGASLLLIGLYRRGLERALPAVWRPKRRELVLTVLGFCLLINLLYFTNILPPVPLVLKDAGIYHNVTRVGDTYSVSTETKAWRDYLRLKPIIHYHQGEALAAYSAVFAPTNLNTTVIHEWQYYDEAQSEWQTLGRIRLPIRGGRDGGYRGYSRVSALRPGAWRVNILTERGQLIGRISFEAQLGEAKLTTQKLP